MSCRVCNGKAEEIFRKVLLGRYEISYQKCISCGFLQTEEPFWLKESYSEPLSASDTGLVARPLLLAPQVDSIIRRGFDINGRFLDFGGGPGLFVRLMRDRGFDFYRQDRYAEPTFSRYFDLEDLPVQDRRFELTTAFEVMEHLPRPVADVSEILSYSDCLLFTTEMLPGNSVSEIESWWYLGLSHGQHVSFHTQDSLSALASHVGCVYVYLGSSLHLITRLPDIVERLDRDPDMRDLNSLTWPDMQYVLSRRS